MHGNKRKIRALCVCVRLACGDDFFITVKCGATEQVRPYKIIIKSTTLGDYAVNYQVYTPASYEAVAGLAVIYVTDAHEYTDPRMGSMPVVLDTLIAAGTIEPILAVFIDPRDPDSGRNRREVEFLSNPNYAAFIAEELVPLIDSTYKTDPSPDRRAILGVSYGGVNATYCGLTYPEVFHLDYYGFFTYSLFQGRVSK